MATKYQEIWHVLAVGLYYRDHAHVADLIRWENQTLACKLLYQNKAKDELATMTVAS